ncbi:MAG: hypothetical protein FJ098_05770, partial [Deltaproteobacteria bacterium]|nr:hypothetical protein [Deltaproteobacteria bacterium]
MQAARVLVLALLLCTGGCIDSKLIANQMVKTGTLQDMNRAFFMEESSDHAAA